MTPFIRGFADELLKTADVTGRAMLRAAEMGLAPVTKRIKVRLGDKWLWKKHASPVKKSVTFDGLPLKLEYVAGDLRKGKNKKTGEPWEKRMHAAYGYIPKTTGHDGEAADIYLARRPREGSPVFSVEQVKDDGSLDEHKVMLGFPTSAEAKACYLQHTPAKYFGSIHELSMERFKAQLAEHQDKEKADAA